MYDKESYENGNIILKLLLDSETTIYFDSLYELDDYGFKSVAHMNDFFLEINEEAGKYFNYSSEDTGKLSTNEFTKEFLERGGLITIYEWHIDNNRKQLETAILEKELSELKAENFKLSNQLLRQKIKTHLLPIGISALGFIFSVIAIFYNPSKDLGDELIIR